MPSRGLLRPLYDFYMYFCDRRIRLGTSARSRNARAPARLCSKIATEVFFSASKGIYRNREEQKNTRKGSLILTPAVQSYQHQA